MLTNPFGKPIDELTDAQKQEVKEIEQYYLEHKPPVVPVRTKLLVLIHRLAKVKAGSSLILDITEKGAHVDDKYGLRMKMHVKARVMALGSLAFKGWDESEAPKIGDDVLLDGTHAGKPIVFGGRVYKIVDEAEVASLITATEGLDNDDRA